MRYTSRCVLKALPYSCRLVFAAGREGLREDGMAVRVYSECLLFIMKRYSGHVFKTYRSAIGRRYVGEGNALVGEDR